MLDVVCFIVLMSASCLDVLHLVQSLFVVQAVNVHTVLKTK